MSNDVLSRLTEVLAERKGQSKADSYVASLPVSYTHLRAHET